MGKLVFDYIDIFLKILKMVLFHSFYKNNFFCQLFTWPSFRGTTCKEWSVSGNKDTWLISWFWTQREFPHQVSSWAVPEKDAERSGWTSLVSSGVTWSPGSGGTWADGKTGFSMRRRCLQTPMIHVFNMSENGTRRKIISTNSCYV